MQIRPDFMSGYWSYQIHRIFKEIVSEPPNFWPTGLNLLILIGYIRKSGLWYLLGRVPSGIRVRFLKSWTFLPKHCRSQRTTGCLIFNNIPAQQSLKCPTLHQYHKISGSFMLTSANFISLNFQGATKRDDALPFLSISPRIHLDTPPDVKNSQLPSVCEKARRKIVWRDRLRR